MSKSSSQITDSVYQTLKCKQDEALKCFADFIRNPTLIDLEVSARKMNELLDIVSQFTKTACQSKGLLCKEGIQYCILRGVTALSWIGSDSLVMEVAKKFTFCSDLDVHHLSRLEMVLKVEQLQVQSRQPNTVVWIEKEVERKGFEYLATASQLDDELKAMITTAFKEEPFVGIDEKMTEGVISMVNWSAKYSQIHAKNQQVNVSIAESKSILKKKQGK